MNPETAAALIARARAAHARGRPDVDASPEAMSPVTRYQDATRFECERVLARRFPQAVRCASDLAAPGNAWAGTVLGVPVLVTRDASGTLRAFLNVCRHRGARLMAEGEVCAKVRHVCPYHAWTYESDGRLVHVPGDEGFPTLDRRDAGLRPLAVAEGAGMIWVIPDVREAGRDVRAELGPFLQDLESFGLHTHRGDALRERDLACDWKLIVEGSSEAYHFKVAHRNTIARLFADNLQLVDEAGLHRRMLLVKQAVPAEDAGLDVRATGNLLYFFFPLTLILVQPDHAQVTRLEPLGPGVCRIADVALIPDRPHDARAREHWDRNVQLYRDTLDEDYALMESIQAGLASGANEALRFGRHESALVRFHQQLDAELARQVPVTA